VQYAIEGWSIESTISARKADLTQVRVSVVPDPWVARKLRASSTQRGRVKRPFLFVEEKNGKIWSPDRQIAWVTVPWPNPGGGQPWISTTIQSINLSTWLTTHVSYWFLPVGYLCYTLQTLESNPDQLFNAVAKAYNVYRTLRRRRTGVIDRRTSHEYEQRSTRYQVAFLSD